MNIIFPKLLEAKHGCPCMDHPEMGCRKLAKHFSVGKTIISNILIDSKNLRKEATKTGAMESII